VRWRSIDPYRELPVLVLLAAAGCGGGGAPKSDAEAVAQTLRNAASAVSKGDGDKACGYLTADAQRQAAVEVGAQQAFGNLDCPTLVKRATAFMSPIDRKQIESLAPSNVLVNGSAAGATLASSGIGSQAQPISVQLTLAKVGHDWKISGFSNAQGLPGS
jgi:hypothetical protein